MKAFRCAIYTRKSTEEGLDQNFNSLHAQREACEAYVLSQAGEGWSAIATLYDDGGFSGGNIERPAMKQLLADVQKGQIDVVVVYKVDRLTRALADFAKIVELFDANGVSFVSVTQAFNTTTSMGRLTLNVLLSFAQFEREVTGERIRDKIAASKAKGMWMGGRPPLGYDAIDRRLVINPGEAETVRYIFRRYLEIGSVVKLLSDLAASGIKSKRWQTRSGSIVGGSPLTRGPLYHLLSNPVYRGAIRHKEKLHEASHPAIVDAATWAGVQAMLTAHAPICSPMPKMGEAALLKGLLHDDRGNRMQPIHVRKGDRRYHYYVTAAEVHGDARAVGSLSRIAAPTLESFVVGQLESRLRTAWKPDEAAHLRVRDALVRLVLSNDRIEATLLGAACIAVMNTSGAGDHEIAVLPIRLKHRQGATLILGAGASSPSGRLDRALVRGVVQASSWRRELESGSAGSSRDLARKYGLCHRHTARLLPLGYLAPDLVAMVLEGRQPRALSLTALVSEPLPMDWDAQRQRVRSFT